MPGDLDRVSDLLQLKAIWEGLGLRVIPMEGWRDRGRTSGNTFEVLGCHHTGEPVDTDRILRDGRSDLPGPLCNVALHANGDVILVASGLANHFGCATFPNKRSLGVEATGPQKTAPRFPNRDAYVALAAGFCIFKGNTDPRHVVRDDVGIPVHLVAAHKEVAVGVPDSEDKLGPDRCQETRTIYGRKVDPDFDEPGPIKKGALAHGFSVGGSGVGLIDRFRDDVHARMSEEDDMPDEQTFKKWVREVIDEELDKRLEGGVVPGQRNIGGTLAVIADRAQKALDAIRAQ
jgi:hypothetical protein